jgi:hypothetical protein
MTYRTEVRRKIVPSVRNNFVVIALALAISAVALPSAQARMSLQEYEKLRAREVAEGGESEGIHLYLLGLLEGIDWATAGIDEKGPQLFCGNHGVKLTDIRRIVENELAAHPEIWRKDPAAPIGPIVMAGLRRKYPCP